MKIHEYQGKELLRQFNVPVPNGIPAFSVDEAVKAAEKLGGPVWVVKAQIHAGGRGKGGGVKLAKSMDDVKKYASEILGMQLKTHQTGPEGQKVNRLLIEDGADIKKEYYFSIVTDRATQKNVIMASSEGGMDIEERPNFRENPRERSGLATGRGRDRVAVHRVVHPRDNVTLPLHRSDQGRQVLAQGAFAHPRDQGHAASLAIRVQNIEQSHQIVRLQRRPALHADRIVDTA